MSKNEKIDQSSDEELIFRLRNGETEITDFIINKYKNLVRKKAKSMFIFGADKDDLIQEGMIGLFKAIRDYDSKENASFYTFADLCIARQIYTAIQAAGRKKHTPLNSYISMSNEDINIKKQGIAYHAGNPEELMIAKENQTQFEKMIHEELSGFEYQVFEMFRVGLSCAEIAKKLDKKYKATDNAIQRIKKKIKKMKIDIAFNS